MKPEVLAWALLFVVVFGVVYRLFAMIGRRLRRRKESHDHADDVAGTEVAPLSAPEHTLAGHAPLRQRVEPAVSRGEPIIEIRQPSPINVAPPIPAPPGASAKIAQRGASLIADPAQAASRPSISGTMSPKDAAAAAAQIAMRAPSPPRPVSVPSNAQPPMPAPLAAEPATPAARPSIAATMSPRDAAATHAPATPLAPNVRATLAPGAKSETRHNAEPPRPAPAAAFSLSIPDATPARAHGANGCAAEPFATTRALPTPSGAEKKPVTLRARKVGEKPPPLDVRIKYAQARKVRTAMKVAAKSRAAPLPAKAVAPRKGIAKAARRTGIKINAATRLLPAKAVTRIVGAPQTAPRVRVAPSP